MEHPIKLAIKYYNMGYRSSNEGGSFTKRECVIHPYIEKHDPIRLKCIGEQAVRLVKTLEIENASRK